MQRIYTAYQWVCLCTRGRFRGHGLVVGLWSSNECSSNSRGGLHSIFLYSHLSLKVSPFFPVFIYLASTWEYTWSFKGLAALSCFLCLCFRCQHDFLVSYVSAFRVCFSLKHFNWSRHIAVTASIVGRVCPCLNREIDKLAFCEGFGEGAGGEERYCFF